MNDTDQAPSESKIKPTTLVYCALTLTIVVLVFLIYSYISNPNVPQNYINDFDSVTSAYQKIGSDSQAEAAQLSSLNQSIGNYSQTGQFSGGVQGIANDLAQNVAQINNIAAEVNDLNATITAFDAIAQSVVNPALRTDSLTVVSLWQEGNESFLALLNDEDQILVPTEQYYQAVAAGKSGTPLTSSQESSIAQAINKESNAMSSLGSSLDEAYYKLSQDTGAQLRIPTSTSQ